MKKILLGTLLIGLQFSVHAKCAFSGIYPTAANKVMDCSASGVFSTTNYNLSVYTNSLIILEFYGSSQNLVPGLGNKYPIYLQCGDQKIALNKQETLKGEFRLTQVVFKPARELTDGKTYELLIEDIPSHEKPVRYNAGINKWESLRYNVISNRTTISNLVFNEPPKELKKTMAYYGCGPAKWVHYTLKAENDIPVYIKTFVKNITTGKTTAYYLSVTNNTFQVGHGMCSGAFTFNTEHRYEISFMLTDHAGNNSRQTTFEILKQPDTETESE